MRTVIALLALPLLFDVAPGTAVKKLGEKKSCSFTAEVKVEGDFQGSRQLGFNLEGDYQKPDVLAAKIGDRGEMVRKGANALYREGQGEWKTKEQLDKERQAQQQQGQNQNGRDPLEPLATLLSPPEDIARMIGKTGGLAKRTEEKVGDVPCTTFQGTLTRDAATAIAKDLLENVRAGGGMPGGGGRMPGGGPRAPGPGGGRGGGGGGSSPPPKDVEGYVQLMVGNEDELPHQMIVAVRFKANLPQRNQGGGGNQTQETQILYTRTLKISDFDQAKIEIPDDVKKRLGISDK